jgi:9-cis-epoxycarotenoid dioxygenase
MFNAKSPVCIDDKKIPRFGVLPRNATTEARIKWFDLPDSTCFHYVNAWEEGDEIVVVGSTLSPIHFTFQQSEKLELRLATFHLNLKTGKAYKQELQVMQTLMVDNSTRGISVKKQDMCMEYCQDHSRNMEE